MKFGAHVSRNGNSNIAEALTSYHQRYPQAELAQIFVVGPLSSRKINLTDSDAKKIRELPLDLYIHSSYLTHPWSDRPQVRGMSRTILAQEIETARLLRAKGLVVHINDKASPESIAKVFSQLDSFPIYLENMYRSPYQESYSNPDNLDRLFQSLPSNLHLCLDSSHLWASGFPVDDRRQLSEYLRRIKKFQPIVHLNDNKYPRGSLKDNHLGVGSGKIWANSQSYQEFFEAGFPIISETPDFAEDFYLFTEQDRSPSPIRNYWSRT